MKSSLNLTALVLVALMTTAIANRAQAEVNWRDLGQKAGSFVGRSREYVRENAPVWKEKAREVGREVRDSSREFGAGFKSGFKR